MTEENQKSWARWFAPKYFAAWLWLGIVAAFPKVVVGWESFFYRDFGVLGYPFFYHLQESLLHGEVPLWNPLSNCGAPFLAQWGTMVLYPGAWVAALLPLPQALNYFCLAHLFLAGLGMYWLVRREAGNDFAASVSGVAFVFSGAMFGCMIWSNYLVALGWMPWVVLWTREAWRNGGRKIVLAGFAATMQLLAGTPELVTFTWVILAGLAAADVWRKQAAVWAMVRRTGGIVLLAAGLGAAQLLPFLDLLAQSQREPGFAVTKWAMPGWGWANLFVPLFHCFETPTGNFFEYDQAFLSSYYPGVVVLVLAAWSLRRPRAAVAVALWVLTLLSLVLALGDNGWLYPWLKQVWPAIGIARFPVKFVLLATFALPWLAGLAVAQLEEKSPEMGARLGRRGAISFAVVGVIVGGLIALAYAHPLQYDQPAVTKINGLWRLVFLGAGLGLLAVIYRFPALGLLRCGLLAVLWLDVFTHTPPQNPSLETELFHGDFWEAATQLKAPKHGEGRVFIEPKAEEALTQNSITEHRKSWLGKRLALWSNLNVLDGVPKVNGASTLQLREQRQLEDLMYKKHAAPSAGLLDFLGVKYITAPGKIVDWTNRTTALPLATAGAKPVFAAGTNALAALFATNFNPRATVVLPEELRGEVRATNGAAASVVSAQYREHEIQLGVEASGPALVVLAQAYYHCWRPYVDGQPAKLLRANYAFQAVEVPEGKHTVRLTYEDDRFVAGIVISTMTFMIAALFWFRANKAGRRETVETVSGRRTGADTGLKPGVNEKGTCGEQSLESGPIEKASSKAGAERSGTPE